MTYSEKLKDGRWLDFRHDFIQIRKSDRYGRMECDECGQDTQGSLHVHHRLYRPKAEPWEYSYDELRLICAECHQRVHDTEHRVRALILSIAPHECYEMNDLLSELESAHQRGLLKISLARAKNTVRHILHS